MSTQAKIIKRNYHILKNLKLNFKFVEMLKKVNSKVSNFKQPKQRTRNLKECSIANCRSLNDSSRNIQIQCTPLRFTTAIGARNLKSGAIGSDKHKKVNLPSIHLRKGKRVNSPIPLQAQRIRVFSPIPRSNKEKLLPSQLSVSKPVNQNMIGTHLHHKFTFGIAI